jgi:mono/diheme cytochrome c family protein
MISRMRTLRPLRPAHLTLAAAATFVAVALSAVSAQAPKPTTVWDGAYTAAQAQRGTNAYSEHCSECHGSNLQGGEAPSLSGDKFWNDWRESTVDALLGFVSKNMPFDDGGALAGKLSPNMYADIVAHILNSNGLPSGTTELSATTAVGVQIIAKDGPGELPASTLARIVGCLEKVGSNFQLVKGSRPARAGANLPPAAQVELGDRTIALKFLLTPLDRYVGQKMAATGLLLGEGGKDGINVENVVPVSPTCQ